jgi:hypothetical protein
LAFLGAFLSSFLPFFFMNGSFFRSWGAVAAESHALLQHDIDCAGGRVKRNCELVEIFTEIYWWSEEKSSIKPLLH